MGVPQSPADGLDRDLLIARRPGRQTTPGDVGRRVCGVVAQTLLRLSDVGEPKVEPVVLVDDMVQTEGHVRDGLLDVVYRIEIGADQRIVDAGGKGSSGIQRLRQGTFATERDLVVWKRRALQGARLRGVGVV